MAKIIGEDRPFSWNLTSGIVLIGERKRAANKGWNAAVAANKP